MYDLHFLLIAVFVDRSRQVAYQAGGGPVKTSNRHSINPKKFLETRTIGNKLHGRFLVKLSSILYFWNYKLLSLLFADRPERLTRTRPLTRTVENDIQLIDDPMGEEYSFTRPTLHNRHASLQLSITAHNDAAENRFGGSRLVNQLCLYCFYWGQWYFGRHVKMRFPQWRTLGGPKTPDRRVTPIFLCSRVLTLQVRR